MYKVNYLIETERTTDGTKKSLTHMEAKFRYPKESSSTYSRRFSFRKVLEDYFTKQGLEPHGCNGLRNDKIWGNYDFPIFARGFNLRLHGTSQEEFIDLDCLDDFVLTGETQQRAPLSK